MTISQMTPGPIAINAATFVGIRVVGWQGALCATMGCVFPACVIVTVIAYFYVKYRHMEGLQMVLNTLRPAVIALILTSGITILTQAFFRKSYRSSTDQLDTGWYFYYLYVPFIEKEKRSDHCHAVCRCAKCDRKFFDGNINKIIGSDRFE